MKKYLYIPLITIALTTLSTQLLEAQNRATLIKDSVAMGASYANEIYYSMTNGEIASVPRNQWDIAFRTKAISSSILINEGAGVKLYTYSKADTSGWATFDTTGMKWTPMYNSYDNWEDGAFSRNSYGQYDYGWAIYNLQTHNLTADSLFVIKLRDGSFRKLWMVRKYSSLNKYNFRVANLDGSAESNITADCSPYTSKNFVGYSIQTSELVDFEPAKDSWDLLFTKYYGLQPDSSLYPVTGVIINDGLKAVKYEQVDPNFIDWGIDTANTSRTAIGWDWKVLNMETFTYEVKDSLIYFVQDLAGNMNKLMFTKFEGSSTGKIVFDKALISSAGINENSRGNELILYPNPAKEKLNIRLDQTNSFPMYITLSALTGRVVHSVTITKNTGNDISIPVNDIPNGMYLVTTKSATGTSAKKVVVNKY